MKLKTMFPNGNIGKKRVKLNKEYFNLSKLILAKISLQQFLNHKAQQTGTYNC